MILIADSGSSKTDWRLVTSDASIQQVKTIGFNPYYQDSTSIAEELKLQLLPKVQEPLTQIYYYGTGITNSEKSQVLIDAFKSVFLIATAFMFITICWVLQEP
jgi:hypothetical protein